MNFSDFIASNAPALAEGAVLERVRRHPEIVLDPQVLNGGLVYDTIGRKLLEEVHAGYMSVARRHGLPLLTFTDTWRCSRKAIVSSRFKGRPVNEDNARFLTQLRSSFGDGSPIFVGGLVGPSGDAYRPDESLDRHAARDFHRPQVEALASSGVDFLHLATAPNVDESLGVADVMAATGLPYMVSFVIRRTGSVLDGTPLGDAMERIDAEVIRAPIGYSVNCVHARVLEQALETAGANGRDMSDRLLTFQGNAADMEVEDLDGSAELFTEPATVFADTVGRLGQYHGLRIVGGCCGTDDAHIEALARWMICEGLSK